ncbi:MAG: SIMPL domain-containing protein [Pseudomonadaceae bacterium]|nr:SIMPL domain-containing protein [Pseudomonadaceae bacterium]
MLAGKKKGPEDMDRTLVGVALAGLLAVGAAYVLGSQIASVRLADRVVTVRGAAELPAVADLATWNLGLSASGNDLKAVQGEIAAQQGQIRAFLANFGIAGAEVENQNVSVVDGDADRYNRGAGGPRFTINGGVTVRTGNLEGIAKAKNALGELVGQGVILTSSWGPNYAFTRLNDKKPELVSAATAEARKAAEQFAADSGAKVGGIRRATQGSVQILGRDGFEGESEQVNKILRVVTTVDYELN